MSNSTNPTVSIVIPAYNAAPWIAETIDSVLKQTFQDFEIIVVDDGSTDATPEVVAAYEQQVQYLRKDNGGQSSARNFGIRAARGSYIAFLDADDLWVPEKLQLQMQLFSEQPDLAMVYSDSIVFESQSKQELYRISSTTKLYAGNILRPLLLRCFIQSPTPVVKHDVFETVGYFNESPIFRVGEDWDMWLRIATEYQVGFVSYSLAKYRRHSESSIRTAVAEHLFQGKIAVVDEAVARSPKQLSDLKERAIANVYASTGDLILSRRDNIGARKMYKFSLDLYPYQFRTILYWLATFLPGFIQTSVREIRQLLQRHGIFV